MGVDVIQSLNVKELEVSSAGVLTRKLQQYIFPASAGAVGGTTGWLMDNDTGSVRLVAGNTNSTWIIPIVIKIGMIITKIGGIGQMDSAGNTVVLDIELRRGDAIEQGISDGLIVGVSTITKTADYLVNDESATISATQGTDAVHYVLIKGTTAATTDIEFLGILLTVTEK